MTATRDDEAALARVLDVAAGALPDDATVVTVAHRLAGASFSVGAMRLARAASALEGAAKRHDPAALGALRAALHAEMVAAKAAMTEFVAARSVELAA